MELEFASYTGYLISTFLLAGIFYAISKFVSSNLHSDKKDTVALWLMGVYQDTWTSQYRHFFEVVFGKYQLSWRCLFASCISSLLAVSLIYLIFSSGKNIFGEYSRIEMDISFSEVFVLGVILNFIPDYISLFKVRWLLQYFSRISSFSGQVVLLITDTIATLFISGIYLLLIIPLFDESHISAMKLVAIFSIYSIFFYSTFITSFWAWMYCLSTWTVRLISKTRMVDWLPIEDKPIQQIGLASATVTIVLGLFLLPFIARQSLGTPNTIEQWACYLNAETCGHVANLTNDEFKKILLFQKACEAGRQKYCSEVPTDWLDKESEITFNLFRKSCTAKFYLACYNLGIILKSQGKNDQAQQAYQSAIKYEPRFNFAHLNLGVLQEIKGRYSDAEKSYRTAIELDPQFSLAHRHLGVLLRKQAKYENAEKSLLKAIELAPKDPVAFVHLGVLFEELKQYRSAEKAVRSAIKLDPKNINANYNLGVYLEQQRKYTEAKQYYRYVIELDAEHPKAYVNLGNVLDVTGEYILAEEAYYKAIEINSNDSNAFFNLSIMLANQGRFQTAEKTIRTAIKIEPTNIRYLQFLNALLTQKGSEIPPLY